MNLFLNTKQEKNIFNVNAINDLVSNKNVDLNVQNSEEIFDKKNFPKIQNLEYDCDNLSITDSIRGVKNFPIEKTRITLKKDPDARRAYKINSEKILNSLKNTYTIDQIVFDQDFVNKFPHMKTKCLEIFWEFKEVLEDRIGKAPEKFKIRAKIEGQCTLSRAQNVKRSPEMERAIIEKLDREYADGVLQFPDDHGIIPKNILPIMAIPKKDENGNIKPICNGFRIVADCSRNLNKITSYAAIEIDSLSNTLNKAAKASLSPYKMKFDISNAFFQIPLDKNLWSYFCIMHPIQGLMVYTRACQGWVASFGYVKNAFQEMFSKFHDRLYRYMDDGFIHDSSEEKFLDTLRLFLSTCKYYGLKLKGSKLALFQKEMNFLGSVVRDGKILPNPHNTLKVKSTKITDLVRVTDLRRYLGMITFLANHLHRSTDILKHLRKLISAETHAKIDWSQKDGFYVKEFEKSLRALDELTVLTPFDHKKPAFIIVDTSADGTGAILFQKNEKNENIIVAFFSRKRLDDERQIEASSCVLETAGMTAAVNFWRNYLEDSPFVTTVYTDSKSLEAVAKRFANNNIPSDVKLINRFFSNLQGLSLRVKHVPGKSMYIKGVDLMSRNMKNSPCTDKCDICRLAKIPNNVPKVFINHVGEFCQDLKSKYKFHKDDVSSDLLTPDFSATNSSDGCVSPTVKKYSNGFELQYLIAPIRDDPSSRMNLQEFLRTTWLLREIQSKDKILRAAAKIISNNENCPPKKPRIETLVHTKKSFLEGGVLKYFRWVGLDRFKVIPIPVESVFKALNAVHNEGCRSPSQMLNFYNRHFETPNAKSFIDEFSKKCQKCVLLRRESGTRQVPMKRIPVPQIIGEQIYVDEVIRRDRHNNEVRLLFATEGLSRYGLSQMYSGSLDSEKFIKFMTVARTVLAPLHKPDSRVIIRCDGASPHTSEDTIKRLKQLGMYLEIYQSSSLSKNIIPEHDSRIKLLSKFLNVSLNDKSLTAEQAVLWSTLEYNQSLTNLNWSSAEIFTKRQLGSQLDFALSNGELISRIEKCREISRATADRERERRRKRKKLSFIPWKDKYLNTPEILEVLRKEHELLMIGDKIKLHVQFDKNNLNRLYTITDIDWKNKKISAKKSNFPNSKIKIFDMESIDTVISDKIRVVSREVRKRRKLLAPFIVENFAYDIFEVDKAGDLEIRLNKENDSGLYSPLYTPAPTPPADQSDSPVFHENEIYPFEVTIEKNPKFVPATPEGDSTIFNENSLTAHSELNDSDLNTTVNTEINITNLDFTISKKVPISSSPFKNAKPPELGVDLENSTLGNDFEISSQSHLCGENSLQMPVLRRSERLANNAKLK